MTNLSMKNQVVTVRVLCLAIAIYGVSIYGFEVRHFFMMAAGFYVFTRIGGDVGFHRYFCHHSFRTHRFFEIFLLVLGTLANIGSSLTWVGAHLAHHAHSDREGDPHSPSRIGIYRVFALDWDHFHFPVSSFRRLPNKQVHTFLHKHYLETVLIFMMILGFINSELLVYFYALAIIYSFFATGIVNTVGHLWGYRNFDTADKSHNNLIVHILSLGGGMHNNHHAHPSRYDYSASRWYEIDPAAILIRALFIKRTN
jgi:fatty-acid desaturase